MEWNRETILHFIGLIKQRPAIWDFQSPEYKLKRKRHEAIEEVALLMGVPPKEVNSKWIILRNQYSREKRKVTESADSDAKYVTKWYAYKDMDMLMTRNRRIGVCRNFWNQETKSDDEDDSGSSPTPPPSRPSASGQSQTKDVLIQNSLSIYNQAIKTLKSIREQQNEFNSDELTNYGMYIAAHLRRFTPQLQSRAKYEINKIMYALDLESMGEYSEPLQPTDTEDIEIPAPREFKYDPLNNQNKE